MKKVLMTIVALMGISLIAAPVKSMLGSGQTEVLDEWEPTALDYVQDGLVAMWDGIENAGWGMHNDDATEWIDCINGLSLKAGSDKEITDYSFCLSRSNSTFLRDPYLSILKDCLIDLNTFTIEIIAFPGIEGDALHLDMSSKIYISSWYGSRLVFQIRDGSVIYMVSRIDDFPWSGSVVAIDRKRILYLNGNLVKTQSLTVEPSSFRIMEIGKSGIFCIRIYNTSLSDNEIKWNNYVDRVRFGL